MVLMVVFWFTMSTQAITSQVVTYDQCQYFKEHNPYNIHGSVFSEHKRVDIDCIPLDRRS